MTPKPDVNWSLYNYLVSDAPAPNCRAMVRALVKLNLISKTNMKVIDKRINLRENCR